MKKDYTLKPIDFPEANKKYVGKNMGDLPTHSDGESIISIWKAPIIARLRFLLTGKINLCIKGASQPPVWLSIGNPFIKT